MAAFAVIGTVSAAAQQSEPNVSSVAGRATWTFDPEKGTMVATPAPSVVVPGRLDPEAVANATPTSTTYTGTILMTVAVKLVSPLSPGAVLLCTGGVGVDYTVTESSTSTTGTFPDLVGFGPLILQNSQSTYATISGTKATCSFSIPYTWTIPASSTSGKTQIVVTVQGITGSVGIAEHVLDTTFPVNAIRTARSTSVGLTGPTTIPPDGTKTTLTGSAVL
jgi:hypothetical protein